MPPTTSSLQNLDTHQRSCQKNGSDMFISAVANDQVWWDAIDSWTEEALQLPPTLHDQYNAGIVTPLFYEFSPLLSCGDYEEDIEKDTRRIPCETTCIDKVDTIHPHLEVPSTLLGQTTSSSKKRKRKQNHSCDQCRVAKRACDLPLDIGICNGQPSKDCATCNTRGLQCTTVWLNKRKSNQGDEKQTRKPQYTSSRGVAEDDKPFDGLTNALNVVSVAGLTSALAPEADLTRQIIAEQTCAQQFNLYVDVWDMPMVDCLSHAHVRPFYGSGFEALIKLSQDSSFSQYLNQAQSWIKNYWQMSSDPWDATSAGPHLFFVASLLDVLFQNGGGSFSRAATESRDMAINETYRWVALSNAAQFAIGKPGCNKASSEAREFALVAWRKARQLLFDNIAATTSFRLALALVLFGVMLPPIPTDPNSAEDVAYARTEGVRRLQSLCVQARSRCVETPRSYSQASRMSVHGTKRTIHPVQELPSDARELVLDLIDLLSSLANIINWVLIGISQGQICPSPPALPGIGATKDDLIKGVSQGRITDLVEVPTGRERDLEITTAAFTAAGGIAVTGLWNRGAEDEEILRAVLDSVPLVVMLWKSLALLIVAIQNVGTDDVEYEEILLHHATMNKLSEAWRAMFGKFDEDGSLSIQYSKPSLRRSVLFCSSDGDLAVLQFCEVIDELEAELAQAPSAPAKERLLEDLYSARAHREDNRLVSATQVSFLASGSQGVSSPGFQGGAGLKASVQDIAAHPHPQMMVQAFRLAAKALSNEVQNCIARMDTERASSMTARLDACLKGLCELKKSLVMFPDVGQVY
ncbi:hypothetical protein PV08_09884 [Exophiala spinifera]|uniref:Zn(2)-C6 fungal-type domain-containing protein n=1 Tax=Exophiala spinifera TaxID=91928 RepID=A0A0D1YCG2_9EURO|nr:uncharacterized protein PV08_09884 [Exophiala spinifera]KIW12606.1 hypothetical protein PV08_09884 [Exophiala spinifera]